jgi:t-SNARE complex subunit (syntaxin)
MKQIHENSSSKKISQRIIEGQIDGMTKNFCEIMDKYYQLIINYREKCKERVQRQYQIGFDEKDIFFY